jgi:hypothetical protein
MCQSDADSTVDKPGYIPAFKVANVLNSSRKEAEQGQVKGGILFRSDSEYTAGYLAALDMIAERLGLKTVKEYRS